MDLFTPLIIVIGLFFLYLFTSIKVLAEYERAVVFRLGRVLPQKGPGLIFVPWPIDSMQRRHAEGRHR